MSIQKNIKNLSSIEKISKNFKSSDKIWTNFPTLDNFSNKDSHPNFSSTKYLSLNQSTNFSSTSTATRLLVTQQSHVPYFNTTQTLNIIQNQTPTWQTVTSIKPFSVTQNLNPFTGHSSEFFTQEINGSNLDFFQIENITNSTSDYTEFSKESWDNQDIIISTITATVLAIIILITIIGNVFVIAAILLERNLRSVANYLILSLAVADLLVAVLVMPLAAVVEVSKEWLLGREVCDVWTSSDVLCCTASILHLVAIALDRYWAVTHIDYMHQRSPRLVGTMIATIWGVSALVSVAPLMGWKDADWENRILKDKLCLVSQDIGYQVFATIASFYLPLTVILLLYWNVYKAARKRIRKKIGSNAHTALCKGTVAISETTTFTRVSNDNSPECNTNGVQKSPNEEEQKNNLTTLNPGNLPKNRIPRRREQDVRKERKAAKTLGIITGAFIICWLPFFIMALVMSLCKKSCEISPYLVSTLIWLGYLNSTINPVLYTIFSPDFRYAFKRILCGKKRRPMVNSSRFSSAQFSKS